MGYKHFRKSAVLIPLIEVEGETHILFEVRSMALRSQPGDICFPGGRIDKEDESPRDCAIRETSEELGILKTGIQDVTPLDYVVSDFGRIIYPYIGTITKEHDITPNPSEVAQVFTVPLAYFLHTSPEIYKVKLNVVPEADFPFDSIVGGENYNWQLRHIDEFFYRYEDKVIWGLTAKILHHFITVVQQEEIQ